MTSEWCRLRSTRRKELRSLTFNGLHGVISQRTELCITNAVWTSDLTLLKKVYSIMYYTKLSTVLLYLIMEIITCKLVSMFHYRILTWCVEDLWDRGKSYLWPYASRTLLTINTTENRHFQTNFSRSLASNFNKICGTIYEIYEVPTYVFM
jgi:hypothetical protein